MPEKTVDLSHVDHVLLGIGDLQRGIEELEKKTGVRAVFGGAHPGRGTQNALIALGGEHYLEILAPNPAEAGNPDAAELHALQTLTPIGWAARSADLAALRQSLEKQGIAIGEIRPGGRNLPDGSRLSWQTLGFAPPASPLLPFFIEWEKGERPPLVDLARGMPPGRPDPRRPGAGGAAQDPAGRRPGRGGTAGEGNPHSPLPGLPEGKGRGSVSPSNGSRTAPRVCDRGLRVSIVI
jgi:hypothetical protein